MQNIILYVLIAIYIMKSSGIFNINKYGIFKNLPSFKKKYETKILPNNQNVTTYLKPRITYINDVQINYKSDVESHSEFQLTTLDKILFVIF